MGWLQWVVRASLGCRMARASSAYTRQAYSRCVSPSSAGGFGTLGPLFSPQTDQLRIAVAHEFLERLETDHLHVGQVLDAVDAVHAVPHAEAVRRRGRRRERQVLQVLVQLHQPEPTHATAVPPC